jgi:hypothetical protein
MQIYSDYHVANDKDIGAENMLLLMLQFFDYTWVFTYRLFFVGMLTSQTLTQSSINNKVVTRVLFSILAARLFQVMGACFTPKAFMDTQGRVALMAQCRTWLAVECKWWCVHTRLRVLS